MEAENFVTELKKLSPPKSAYLNLGYPPSLAAEKLKAYECMSLNTKELSHQYFGNNVLLELLCNYNCSKIEIGVVSFVEKLVEVEDYYIIGNVEADILALNKLTLEVEVLDHENLDWTIWSCAANSEYFLNAILKCAEYFNKTICSNELSENSAFTYEYVLQCSDKAGGDKYIEFYKMLLGYDIIPN
ncbi:MAG TPA: hypothetical protein VEY10_02740 [Flavisolibacter sp.]|jgi:hypothetical protein|nr:hypothetical protein [Flavisolibacter sp.]